MQYMDVYIQRQLREMRKLRDMQRLLLDPTANPSGGALHWRTLDHIPLRLIAPVDAVERYFAAERVADVDEVGNLDERGEGYHN